MNQISKNQSFVDEPLLESNIDELIEKAFDNYCQGKFNLSLAEYSEALAKAEEENNERQIASICIFVGHIYKDQGLLHLAENMYRSALVNAEKTIDMELIAWAKSSLALIYQDRGEFENAKILLKESIHIFKELKMDRHVAHRIFDLLFVEQLAGDSILWSEIMKDYPKYAISTNKSVKTFFYMIMAIQQESRYNWGVAELFWKKALEEQSLRFTHQIICYEALIQLSLFKSKLINSKENVDELLKRLDALEKLCKENNIQSTLIKSYIIRAQLAQIYYNFDEAMNWLVKSNQIINTYDLPLHQNLIKNEIEKLKENKNKTQNNVANYQNQIFNQLVDYVKKTNSLIDTMTETQIKAQESISILNEGGLSQQIQQRKILNLLETNSLGIYQKDLPTLTGLSQSTISRRVLELEKKGLIKRIPEKKSVRIHLNMDMDYN